MPAPSTTTIGVFDSGFGGLTVLRALLPLIPGAHYIYLGDTARLPYGAKSQTTIARYAVESARFLATQGADLLVIACNTATALALDDIRRSVPIPVIGVIEPGANAALAVISSYKPRHPERSISRSLRDTESKDPDEAGITSAPNTFQPQASEILVLATAATVQSHAYRHACETLGLHATEVACPLLVPLVEEGWTNHPVTREVLRIYLTEALQQCTPQAILLGCTHYPLIAPAIEQTLRDLGSQAIVINSAQATAQAVADHIKEKVVILNEAKDLLFAGAAPATFTCYATDSIEKFQRLGSHFLGQPIPHVELLDLGG